MVRLIRDSMLTKEELFVEGLLIQLDAEVSLNDSITAMSDKKEMLAIVVIDQERPITIVTVDDLNKLQGDANQPLRTFFSQLPFGVLTIADATLEAFVNSPEFTAMDVGGARGAIVFNITSSDSLEFAGILTGDVVDDYLVNEFQPTGKTMGFPSLWSPRLAGDIIEEPVIKYCADYGHENQLTYVPRNYSPDCAKSPPCHPIWR